MSKDENFFNMYPETAVEIQVPDPSLSKPDPKKSEP
jgi:hypothetical protein